MKNGILYLIILLLSIAVYYFMNRGEKIIYREANSARIDTVYQDRWIDSQGRKHSVIETDGIIKTVASLADPNSPNGPIDTAAKALNVAIEQIQQLTVMNIRSEARALRAEKIIDSLKKTTSFNFTGKYLNLTYYPADSTTLDDYPNGKFDYKYVSDLRMIQYYRRKKFLGIPIGDRKSYTDIFLADTNAYIAPGITRITVSAQTPKVVGRLQASGTINLGTGSYGFGPAAKIDIGRLKFQYQHLYYPISGTWAPSVNVNLDGIRF